MFFCILNLVIIALDCTKGEDDYYPLTVGNRWVYLDTLDAYMYGFIIVSTRHYEIIGTVTDSGRTIWLQESRHVYENDEYIDTLFIEECGDTLWATDYTSNDTFTYILMIQPLTPGQEWDETEVIGYEEVTVPAGTYHDCAVVNSSIERWYYAPNVGLVKYQMEGFHNRIRVLEVYDVK